jgi:catalase
MALEKLVHLTVDEAARKPPDFLVDDLPQRIAKRPVVFHLKAQLAAAGDQTRDPSQPWPDNRHVVDRMLTLDKPVADSLEVQKKVAVPPDPPHRWNRAFRR